MSFPPFETREVVAHCPHCYEVWNNEVDGDRNRPGAICKACKDQKIVGFLEGPIRGWTAFTEKRTL